MLRESQVFNGLASVASAGAMTVGQGKFANCTSVLFAESVPGLETIAAELHCTRETGLPRSKSESFILAIPIHLHLFGISTLCDTCKKTNQLIGLAWITDFHGVSDGLHALQVTQKASRKHDLLVETLVLSLNLLSCHFTTLCRVHSMLIVWCSQHA